MKKSLLSTKDIQPACEYCARGKLSPDGQTVLCIKKGIMLPSSFCRKFQYDPLRRVPKKAPLLPQFDADEFSL